MPGGRQPLALDWGIARKILRLRWLRQQREPVGGRTSGHAVHAPCTVAQPASYLLGGSALGGVGGSNAIPWWRLAIAGSARWLGRLGHA